MFSENSKRAKFLDGSPIAAAPRVFDGQRAFDAAGPMPRANLAPELQAHQVVHTIYREGAKPKPFDDLTPEEKTLHLLNLLGEVVLKSDPDFAGELIAFDKALRGRIAATAKAAKNEARKAFDELTSQGREALQRLEALEGERDSVRAELNRAKQERGQARGHLNAVRMARPKDSDFPRRAEEVAWLTRMEEAKDKVAEAEKPCDELQAQLNGFIVQVNDAKAEVSAIRQRRDAARQKAGLSAPAPEQSDVESETLEMRAR